MGRISVNDLDKYQSQGGATKFFKLENDKDTAIVRFMLNTVDDIEPVVVHEIDVNGKKRYVNCLRSYDEPIDNCPLCKAGMRPLVKMFIPVFNTATNEVQFWQKGNRFIKQLDGFARRHNPMVSTPVEVERNGKKGDQATTYELYACDSDKVTLADLPEIPDVIGTIVLDKSYQDLCDYAEKGFFAGDATPVRREENARPAVSRRQAF